MSYKSIMVALNDVERAREIADVACLLAVKNDAHLIGLFVIPVMTVYPVPGAYVMPEMIEAQEKAFAGKADKAKSLFEAVAEKHGLQHEWRLVHESVSVIANAVIDHGRQADLLVIGQVDPNNNDGIELDFADRVIMETGRPVLVVPHLGTFDKIGENVVVAWNASNHAARAAFDALPILSASENTWLTWVDPQKSDDAADQVPGSELAASLARHDVTVQTDPIPAGKLSFGAALLSRAAEHGADLIVAGAYGHSRMREYVFGGVTRELLKTMTIPVLLSH